MNSSYHEAIKMTPYQALTGNKPRCGLKSNLPDAFISKISSGIAEEELERLIEVPLTGDSAQDDLISVDPECEREPHPVADSQQQPAMEQENISTEVLHPAKQARKEAEYGLQKKAQRMLARSTRSMRAVDVGDNVSVPVSQFDRKKETPNIVGVVLAVEDSDYVIGTKKELSMFLGAFPYTRRRPVVGPEGLAERRSVAFVSWDHTYEKCLRSTASSSHGAFYKKCYRWTVMQAVVILTFGVYIALTMWSLATYHRQMDSRTLITVISIEDVVNLMTSLLITAYFARRKETTLKIVEEFHLLSQTRSSPVSGTHVRLWFVAPVASYIIAAAISLVNIMYSMLLLESLHELPELLFNILTTCFTMSFYCSSMFLISSCYDAIRREVSIQTWDDTDTHNVGSTAILVGEAKVNRSGTRNPLVELKALTLRVQDFQREVNKYMEFPITLILSMAIPGCIMNTFLLISPHHDNIVSFIWHSGFLVSAVVPLLVFPNLPVMVVRQVEELKLLVNRLKRSERFQPIKEDLLDLKEMLEESPGFGLCNFFTLGRPRVLDIFSYVATYLVILLQFRISEWGSDGTDIRNKTTEND
ncbi:uncharacterized protein [Macrobrachium rosenbergii]|uniref:uncharacterized protein n=1 Tax=Macrobrachium rosenbergii TaxID=79674 RepID=UPI0034D6EA2F